MAAITQLGLVGSQRAYATFQPKTEHVVEVDAEITHEAVLPKMPYERRERPVPFSHRPRKPWKW